LTCDIVSVPGFFFLWGFSIGLLLSFNDHIQAAYLMENKSEIVIMVNCISEPPAMPCRALPTISTVISGAFAHIIELTKNHATEIKRIGLRPQISESLAQIGAAAAFARRYAEPIHVYPLAECKSELMVGRAVETIVWSRAATKRASLKKSQLVQRVADIGNERSKRLEWQKSSACFVAGPRYHLHSRLGSWCHFG